MQFRTLAWAVVFWMFLAQALAQQMVIAPTTTLWKETHNNTSAADSFAAQSNGNEGATNVSNVPTRKLLYAGSGTKIYAHLMTWFGKSNHMNVGYSSASGTQVWKQVSDMIRRGIDGAIVDWYGPNSYENQAIPTLKYQAETHPGFEFSIMEDAGSLQNCGCDVTQRVVSDLTYVWDHYAQSNAYIHLNGRPVMFFFGQEAYPIDWSYVRSHVPGNPVFVFRNAGAFTATQSNGGFSWAAPETVSSGDPMALGYLDYFYSSALDHPGQYPFASNYKGFNDTLSSWHHLPAISQQCGQTWLKTMQQIGKYYNATHEPAGIQIVTWNDYEEGTEIETGIDNCVGVSAKMNGGWLTWSISGAQNTLDHFAIWISPDGSNLMHLADVPVGARSVDLGTFAIPAGTYKMFVQAVGQPSIRNHMSGAVTYYRGGTSTTGIAVNVSTPTPGATVNAPIHVAASASSGHAISAMWVYLDGKVVYKAAASSLSAYLSCGSGGHKVVVNAWDASGAVASRTVSFWVK